VSLDEAPSSEASKFCIARRRWRFQRITPRIERINRGTAAPMPAPIPTPVQSLPEFEGSGGVVVGVVTKIEGRLAVDDSTEDNELDIVFEAAELDELGVIDVLDVVDELAEVDDDLDANRDATAVEEDTVELGEGDGDSVDELEDDFAETIKSGAENIRF
jgi:hypothetical protein